MHLQPCPRPTQSRRSPSAMSTGTKTRSPLYSESPFRAVRPSQLSGLLPHKGYEESLHRGFLFPSCRCRNNSHVLLHLGLSEPREFCQGDLILFKFSLNPSEGVISSVCSGKPQPHHNPGPLSFVKWAQRPDHGH